jgi:CBS domain-containing protein
VCHRAFVVSSARVRASDAFARKLRVARGRPSLRTPRGTRRAAQPAMKIANACNPDVAVISPGDTVLEAARMMRERHVGDLVIVDTGNKPLGILTDRDLVVGVLAQDVDHLRTLKVEDVLTQPAIVVRDNDDIASALDVMRRNVIRRVPVVDGRGKLVGIFTLDDLLGVFADEAASIGALVSRQRTYEAQRRP